MRTAIYIDGFNLYYGELKDTPYRWLDLGEVCRKVLKPHHDIVLVRYFTAQITSRPGMPHDHGPDHQKLYLKALKAHTARLEIHLGHFLSGTARRPLANVNPPRTVTIIKTEEKGSDVNLAVHLLNDAWADRYDCAVVVSNDSDLAEAMRIVRRERGKLVGLIPPGREHGRRVSGELRNCCDFIRTLRSSALKASLLPSPIAGTGLYKPPNW